MRARFCCACEIFVMVVLTHAPSVTVVLTHAPSATVVLTDAHLQRWCLLMLCLCAQPDRDPIVVVELDFRVS